MAITVLLHDNTTYTSNNAVKLDTGSAGELGLRDANDDIIAVFACGYFQYAIKD